MTKTTDQITQSLEVPAQQLPMLSQATSIEQSRAIAEVRAMVLISKGSPRDEQECLRQMRLSCGLMMMAENAFYKFPRGGESITGPTIGLARELARCWGNMTHGISELARNDEAGESEMLAFAWDLERNVRPSITFIVPHRRDTKKGVVHLTDMRDIYENNTNQGARRLREMILAALPVWYVEEAKDACQKTLQRGDGKPMPERIAAMVAAFAELGIVVERIEAKLGVGSKAFSALDLARLAISYRSIKREELSAADEFPELTAGKIQQSLETTGDASVRKGEGADLRGSDTSPTKSEGEDDDAPKPKRQRAKKETATPIPGPRDANPPIGAEVPTSVPESGAVQSGGASSDDPGDGEGAKAASTHTNEAAQPRLDLNDPSAPDPNDQPEAFVKYMIGKLAIITDPGSLSLEAMDKRVKTALRGMTTQIRQWTDAVDRRIKVLTK